jgi:hypothetical protein
MSNIKGYGKEARPVTKYFVTGPISSFDKLRMIP